MKKVVKIFIVLIVLGVFACLSLASFSSDSGQDKKIVSVDNGSEAKESEEVEEISEETQEAETETQAAASEETTIEEQFLYDQDDIKITALGFDSNWVGPTLKLLIENNSSKNITVQARNANVNGYMVDTMLSSDVASGKKANDELTFMTSSLDDCGITDIATMEFSLYIFDTETWDDLVSTDAITITTSIADEYTQTYDDSGDLLMDAKGIKIVGKGLSADDSFWGPGVVLYIENNSEKDVTVQAHDVSINGFMVESSMSTDILVGKKAVTAIQFFSSDLEDNSITDITEVEFTFHVYDSSSYNDIYNSDTIRLEFE